MEVEEQHSDTCICLRDTSEMRVNLGIKRAFYRRAMWWHLALACALWWIVLLLARVMLFEQQEQTQHVRPALGQARAQLVAVDLPEANDKPPHPSTDPAQWPLRTEANDVVRQVGEAAQFHSVSLRTLSVSHQAASTQTWGRASLDVSASGSYAAIKAWQADLQQRFPALSVQSLRMQGNSLSQGGLEAQVLWMLHVQD